MNIWYLFDTIIDYWSIEKCSYAWMGSNVLWFQNWYMEWFWLFYWSMEVSRKTKVIFWIELFLYLRWKNYKMNIPRFSYIYRNYFACGIYRNNLVFSGGLYETIDDTTGGNSSHPSIADDIHMFNIRYSL